MTETQQRRTIRRYAHELYPHAGEYEVRPLAVEVPYLYAMAIGLNIWGSDWFDAFKGDGDTSGAALMMARMLRLIDARHTALLADALLQGLSGEDAWRWAGERMDEEGSPVYERAAHYGVPIDQIKPYPVLAEATYHEHLVPSEHGHTHIVRVQRKESECPECTEPVEGGGRDE